MFADVRRMQVPTAFNKAAAEVSHACAADRGAGAWHSLAVNRAGASTAPFLLPALRCENSWKIRIVGLVFFSSADLLGTLHANTKGFHPVATKH